MNECEYIERIMSMVKVGDLARHKRCSNIVMVYKIKMFKHWCECFVIPKMVNTDAPLYKYSSFVDDFHRIPHYKTISKGNQK